MSNEFEKIKDDINSLKGKLVVLLKDLAQRQQAMQPKIDENGLTKENVELVWDFQKYKVKGLEEILGEFHNLQVDEYGPEVSSLTRDIETAVSNSIDETNNEINALFDQHTLRQKIETWLSENEKEVASLEGTFSQSLSTDDEHHARVNHANELLEKFRTMKKEFWSEEMWEESKVILLKAETRLIKVLNQALTAHTDFLNRNIN